MYCKPFCLTMCASIHRINLCLSVIINWRKNWRALVDMIVTFVHLLVLERTFVFHSHILYVPGPQQQTRRVLFPLRFVIDTDWTSLIVAMKLKLKVLSLCKYITVKIVLSTLLHRTLHVSQKDRYCIWNNKSKYNTRFTRCRKVVIGFS